MRSTWCFFLVMALVPLGLVIYTAGLAIDRVWKDASQRNYQAGYDEATKKGQVVINRMVANDNKTFADGLRCALEHVTIITAEHDKLVRLETHLRAFKSNDLEATLRFREESLRQFYPPVPPPPFTHADSASAHNIAAFEKNLFHDNQPLLGQPIPVKDSLSSITFKDGILSGPGLPNRYGYGYMKQKGMFYPLPPPPEKDVTRELQTYVVRHGIDTKPSLHDQVEVLREVVLELGNKVSDEDRKQFTSVLLDYGLQITGFGGVWVEETLPDDGGGIEERHWVPEAPLAEKH